MNLQTNKITHLPTLQMGEKTVYDFTALDPTPRFISVETPIFQLCLINNRIAKAIKLSPPIRRIIHFLIENEAMAYMRENAAGNNISKEKGQEYFDKQYPTVKHFKDETGMWPSEFLKMANEGKFTLQFVNKAFIEPHYFESKNLPFVIEDIYRLPCSLRDNKLSKNFLKIVTIELTTKIDSYLFEYFPKWLNDRDDIESFMLCSELNKIPNFVQTLSNIRTLSINLKNLAELPEYIKNFKHLESLSINSNSFKDLQTVVNILKECTNLRKLKINKTFEAYDQELLNVLQNCQTIEHYESN